MPFAEFQPSNAGAQINDQILRNVDFGTSLMERAQRSSVLAQDAEMRKQRFVTEQVLSDQQIQQNRLQLSRMEGEQKATAAKNRAAVLESDGHFEHLTASEAMLADAAAEAPSLASKLNATTDPDEIESLTNAFVARYAHLAGDKDYAIRFDRVARPVTNVVSLKTTALRKQYAAAANGIRTSLIPGNAESLAAVRQSPFFTSALRDPVFRKEWDMIIKDESERNNKIAEQDNKLKNDLALEKEKTAGRISENAAKSESDKKETPQWLAEKSIKIKQSGDDLSDLEKQLKDQGMTGPIFGFFKRLNPYDTNAQAFEAKLKATVPNLARGVFGEVGVLTKDDFENYLATLPNLKSPEDRAKKLIEQLRTVLARQQDSVKNMVVGQGYKTGGIPGFGPSDQATKSSSTGSTGGEFAAYLAEAKKRGLPVFNSKFSR